MRERRRRGQQYVVFVNRGRVWSRKGVECCWNVLWALNIIREVYRLPGPKNFCSSTSTAA
jgi:hypothetical protein